MSAARSNAPEVRNPVLALPVMARFRALPAAAREALTDFLGDLRADASRRGDEAWTKRKYSSAGYWKVVSVDAGHARNALRSIAKALPSAAQAWALLKADAPPVPPETCPAIDGLSTLADAIAGDIGLVREGLARSTSTIAREAAGELLDTESNLATMRLRLEDLRRANDQLRASGRYWYQAAERLSQAS